MPARKRLAMTGFRQQRKGLDAGAIVDAPAAQRSRFATLYQACEGNSPGRGAANADGRRRKGGRAEERGQGESSSQVRGMQRLGFGDHRGKGPAGGNLGRLYRSGKV